jgi:hypothetical protein
VKRLRRGFRYNFDPALGVSTLPARSSFFVAHYYRIATAI